MKYSIIKNDKSTAKDEILFSLITLLVAVIGICLYVFSSYFSGIESVVKKVAIVLVLLAVMYVPCIIYRLFTNDK